MLSVEFSVFTGQDRLRRRGMELQGCPLGPVAPAGSWVMSESGDKSKRSNNFCKVKPLLIKTTGSVHRKDYRGWGRPSVYSVNLLFGDIFS